MTAAQLLKMVDRCAKIGPRTKAYSNRSQTLLAALDSLFGYDCTRHFCDEPSPVFAALFKNSFDAFIEMLPEGWGWSRFRDAVVVYTTADQRRHEAGCDPARANHGVAALLTAMAHEQEARDDR